ncbi:hypothetical protein TM7_0050 [candidate division TM7 genomosp. GTL1]|nr:hypothetical protein TM7_0050 [candidate division TM7 genomosp. GTL1]
MGPDDKEKSEDKQQDKRYIPGEKFAQEEFGTQGKPPARNEKASENLRDGEANTAGPNKNENVGQAERQGGGKPGGAGGLGGAAAGAASLAGGAAGPMPVCCGWFCCVSGCIVCQLSLPP